MKPTAYCPESNMVPGFTHLHPTRQDYAELATLKGEVYSSISNQWQMLAEAIDQEDTEQRERIVVRQDGKYYATFQWKVNPSDGAATVKLRSGTGLIVRKGDWCLGEYAALDFFDLEGPAQITIDDVREGELLRTE